MFNPKERANLAQIIEAQKQFLEQGGIVYDSKFTALENLDPRKKVAFDLNGALVPLYSIDKGPRERALETLRYVKEHGVKIIIWTAAGRSLCQQILDKTGVSQYVDISITWENYFLRQQRTKDESKSLDVQYKDIIEWERKYSGSIKALQFTPYRLLVDDDWGMQFVAEEEGFVFIGVLPYEPEDEIQRSPLPPDLGERILQALK